MANEITVPKSIYVFRSGKHIGDAAENYIFRNSNYLFYVRNRKHHEKDVLDQHLDFIFAAGAKLQTKTICPFCKKNTVKFFLRESLLFIEGLTCCDEALCKEMLKSLHPGISLIPFRISTLGIFKKVGPREKVEAFFRKIYGMPRRITPDIVFSMLRAAVGAPESLPAQPQKLKKKTKKETATQMELSFQ